jgi:carboxypeptidase Q
MYRCRIVALLLTIAAQLSRKPGRLAILTVVAVVALALGQQPPAAAPPPPAAAEALAPSASSAEALALDQKIIAEAKNGSEIMANLAYLSDMIGPRLTGSAALKRANEWTADKMRNYGLTNVSLEGYTIPMGWERGSAAGRIIEPNNGRTLSLAALGWTPGTNGKIEGEVMVLTARTTADLAALKGKLKNAVILRGPPANVRPISDTSFPLGREGSPPGPGATPPGGRDGSQPAPSGTPGGRAGRGFGQSPTFRRELTEFLRSEGAAAVLQDAGKPHGLLTAGGGWQGLDRPSASDPLPSLFVAHEHYALLHRLATRPTPARTRVEIEVSNKFIPGPIAVYNTVGEIRGTEKPDEYVILGAHLDSWDLAQGTTDNGTGSMVVLEAARILACCGTIPKRTIRFVLFTGEEQGLHGSKAYVKQHKDELSRVSMCLAHDTGTGRVVGVGLQGREVLKPVLEAELVSLKDVGVTDISLRSMGGTDHVSFEQAGVPGFAVRQDMAEYRFTHHSQSDTLDKARTPDLIQGAQVMAVAAMRVANLPTLLPREKKR